MNNQEEQSKDTSSLKTISYGAGFKAKLKFYSCKGTGECIKACKEMAIEEGPQRMPAAVCLADGQYKMLPGRAVIHEDKCNGCGDCVSVCPNKAIEMVAVS